jgi:hypothetical protein
MTPGRIYPLHLPPAIVTKQERVLADMAQGEGVGSEGVSASLARYHVTAAFPRAGRDGDSPRIAAVNTNTCR